MENLTELLEKISIEDAAAIPEIQVPKLSLRHRLKMRRIFASYEKIANTQKRVRIGSVKRIAIMVTVMFFAMISFTAGAAMLRGFNRKVNKDNTELRAANSENSLKTIEYVYYLTEIPEGFELSEQDSNKWYVFKNYTNHSTGKHISFSQYVIEGYKTHLDNEHYSIEETDINGKYALYMGSDSSGVIIWDNEDYILEITGNFTKDDLKKLAKSAKF